MLPCSACYSKKWLTGKAANHYKPQPKKRLFNSINTSVVLFQIQTKNIFLPEQTCHSVAADVVQGRVVLVLLSVRCVRVQAVPELRVALIQLPGQGLVATHQGLAEFGGCVAHDFTLCKGPLKGSCGRCPSACLPIPPSSSCSSSSSPVYHRSQLRATWFSVFLPCKLERERERGEDWWEVERETWKEERIRICGGKTVEKRRKTSRQKSESEVVVRQMERKRLREQLNQSLRPLISQCAAAKMLSYRK